MPLEMHEDEGGRSLISGNSGWQVILLSYPGMAWGPAQEIYRIGNVVKNAVAPSGTMRCRSMKLVRSYDPDHWPLDKTVGYPHMESPHDVGATSALHFLRGIQVDYRSPFCWAFNYCRPDGFTQDVGRWRSGTLRLLHAVLEACEVAFHRDKMD